MENNDERQAVSSHCCPSLGEQLTFGSLFAGIGGIDLGFERAGMVCKWQVEIDGYAQRVLAKHWPDVRRHDDVRTWPQPDTERVDVIAGGFPCQDISYAGKGAGLAGERSGLFYEVARIVSEMEPRIVVLENVAALLTRGLGDVLGTLASLGYDAEWHCIPAAAVGAPHIRDRVFIMAYTSSARARHESRSASGQAWERARTLQSKTIRQEYRETLPKGIESVCCDVANANGEGLSRRKDERTANSKASSKKRRQAIERASWWEVEPDVGRVVDGFPGRVDRLRGLGNAVVPQVAEWIGRRIVEASRMAN